MWSARRVIGYWPVRPASVRARRDCVPLRSVLDRFLLIVTVKRKAPAIRRRKFVSAWLDTSESESRMVCSGFQGFCLVFGEVVQGDTMPTVLVPYRAPTLQPALSSVLSRRRFFSHQAARAGPFDRAIDFLIHHFPPIAPLLRPGVPEPAGRSRLGGKFEFHPLGIALNLKSS